MTDSEEWRQDTRRSDFVERFGIERAMAGAPRMEGRVLGYLMTSDKPYVAARELAQELEASSGSISTTCRALMEAGFIHRHAVRGDRNHYYRVDDDIWGAGWPANGATSTVSGGCSTGCSTICRTIWTCPAGGCRSRVTT